MGEATAGQVRPIDPLIESTRVLGLTPSEVLQQLGIGLLDAREGEDGHSVALRTAQALLKPAYELLVKEVGGTPAEDLSKVDPKRLENPQAFIDSTLALMSTLSGVPPKDGRTDISLSGALSASCLLKPEDYSRMTVDSAKKAVSVDPYARELLPKLRSLSQAAPTK